MHISYWKNIRQDRFGNLGLIVVIIIIALAIFAPLIARFRPSTYTGVIFRSPSLKYILGTNDVGQDIWSRLLYGARTSLFVGFGVGIFSAFLSMLVGGTAALFGGIYDQIAMRFVDAILVIPPIIIAVLVATYLRPNMFVLILLLSFIIWPGGARIIRAQTLSLKERQHILASKTFGANWIHLILKHVVPDLGPILIAILITDIRRAIFMEAGLSFLGISDPTMISWGTMIQHALQFSYLEVWKWWLLPAGFAISLTVVSFTFIGYAMETTLNPLLLKNNE